MVSLHELVKKPLLNNDRISINVLRSKVMFIFVVEPVPKADYVSGVVQGTEVVN